MNTVLVALLGVVLTGYIGGTGIMLQRLFVRLDGLETQLLSLRDGITELTARVAALEVRISHLEDV